MADPDATDWASLHARIARASANTHALLSPDAASERRILDERARRLAAPPPRRADLERTEFALFTVGRERYAIETRYVRRIAAFSVFEAIPWTTLPFLGVQNHQGAPLPVVDLRALLASSTVPAELALLLVLGEQRDELGLAISVAEEVTAFRSAECVTEHLPESLRDIAFVQGIHQTRRVVLAGEALLRDPRLVLGDGP
jgi:chemotaxis signal transduction protein